MSHFSLRGRGLAASALLGTTALVAAAMVPLGSASAVDEVPAARAKQGTVNGVMDHLIRFERIGDKHDGRAAGEPGYEASAKYVARKLRQAGFEPWMQEFDFPYYAETGPSKLERTAPDAKAYAEETDYILMTYSGSGNVTDVTVEGVDLKLAEADRGSSTSGCEAEDFATFTAGNIALMQRGACAFADKVVNAQEAGAVAAIVMNQGNNAGRMDAFAGTLGGPVATIPALGTSFMVGEELAAEGTKATVVTETESEIRQTWNVIADTRGRKANVVMAGAHLDSVHGANGINDNGSGSAALLEVAEKMGGDARPNNRVRFAWWGAEELGLLGSEHYVADLSERRPGKFQKIALYLNFDMVGSPNYMLGVYDGDNSVYGPEEGAAIGPDGSAAIEAMFQDFFSVYGTGSSETPFSGRSDYGPFIALNVPAGGLFTGAEGVKTPEQAVQFGGTAGAAYDECYHSECDDLGNVSRDALKANTSAILHAVQKYARSTRSVNGKDTGHEPPAPEAPRMAVRHHHADGHDHGGVAR
ncbi:M28 family peptidase [Nocardioides sp. GCM10027113]|uniref:M28 family peptidase n=1 Tax=unclassified Nocardioides TaxID=2615069 RepID=UPI00361C38E7